jgi:hypothetical protein
MGIINKLYKIITICGQNREIKGVFSGTAGG